MFHNGRMVADADRRDRQAGKLAVQALLIGGIQRARGLVKQQVARLGEQGPGKCQALLLTDRKHPGPVHLGAQAAEALGQRRQIHLGKPVQQLFIRDVSFGLGVGQLAAQVAQRQVGLLGQEQHVRAGRAHHLA